MTTNTTNVGYHSRLVCKDSLIYEFSCCAACGTGWGAAPGAAKQGHTCEVTVCKACGGPQCLSNGLAGGQCLICYVGLLPGWSGSDRKCDYKGCKESAIARTGGLNKYVCVEHLKRKRERAYVDQAQERIQRDFQLR